MFRYLKLYWLLTKQRLLHTLEYRLDFLLIVVRGLMWLGLAVFFFAVIFANVDRIVGWSFAEMLLLYGTYQLVFQTLGMTVWGSLSQLPSMIRQGELDLFLVKPIHPQFSFSVHGFRWGNIASWLVSLLLIYYALRSLQVSSMVSFMVYFLMIAAAIAIFYSLFLLVVTTAFWWVDLYNLDSLFASLINLGRIPTTVYPGVVKLALIFVVPVAFVGTVPAESLVKIINWGSVMYGFSIAIILLWLSRKFFLFGLEHYSSASS